MTPANGILPVIVLPLLSFDHASQGKERQKFQQWQPENTKIVSVNTVKQAHAFGLKARLSRLLNDERTMVRLGALLKERRVRIVRLTRRNPIKQALA